VRVLDRCDFHFLGHLGAKHDPIFSQPRAGLDRAGVKTSAGRAATVLASSICMALLSEPNS
jgi:hypothetical protein